MNQMMIPIFSSGLAIFIVLLGGLIGGASIGLILKRIFIFGPLMGGMGFVLNFLLQKWGILSDIKLGSSPSVLRETQEKEEGTEEEKEMAEDFGSFLPEGENQKSTVSGKESSESMFDYTVKDEEEIDFRPLDETILERESSKNKYLEIEGGKIEYNPQRAAQAIRQLLVED